jgi:hypothetical protein
LASENFEFTSTVVPRNSMIDGLASQALLPSSIMATLGAASIKGSNVLSLVDFGISQRNEANTQELATFIATLCPTAQIQGSDIWKEVSVILKVNQATRLEDQRKIDTLRAEVERLMLLLNNQGQVPSLNVRA